jgi:hypothetical protein
MSPALTRAWIDSLLFSNPPAAAVGYRFGGGGGLAGCSGWDTYPNLGCDSDVDGLDVNEFQKLPSTSTSITATATAAATTSLTIVFPHINSFHFILS